MLAQMVSCDMCSLSEFWYVVALSVDDNNLAWKTFCHFKV